MITVRFSTGVAVQYNAAHFVHRGTEYTDLRDKEGGRLIAQVPTAGCIVEMSAPCRVYNSNHEPGGIVDALNQMIADPARRRLLPTYELAELKRRLGTFNAKAKEWTA